MATDEPCRECPNTRVWEGLAGLTDFPQSAHGVPTSHSRNERCGDGERTADARCNIPFLGNKTPPALLAVPCRQLRALPRDRTHTVGLQEYQPRAAYTDAVYRGHESSDPPFADFPLTTQITPTNIHICRACNKVPAVLAIVGDIRLGESPFLICRPCWRWMGLPKGEDAEKIEVVTLPKHAVSCVQ